MGGGRTEPFSMNDQSHCWYIRGKGCQTADAFTTEELLHAWRTGRLDSNTTCWCDGMPEWLPMRKVEPFASAVRVVAPLPPVTAKAISQPLPKAAAALAGQATGKKTPRLPAALRLLLPLVMAFAVLAGTGVAYVNITESRLLREARLQIISGDYDAAIQTMSDLPRQYFHKREAAYLRALVDLKKYASAKQLGEDASLPAVMQPMKEVLDAREAWQARARLDLENLVAQVPTGADDVLPRSLAIAQALDELQAFESAALADALVKKAEKRARLRASLLDASNADYVKQILDWDPSLAENVVDLAIPFEGPPTQGVAAIRAWAGKMSGPGAPGASADALSAGLMRVAERYVAKGKYAEAGSLVDAAKQIDSYCEAWNFWEEHFQKTRESDVSAAVEILRYMVRGEHNRERLQEAVRLYTDLKSRNAEKMPPPPPEIGDEMDRAEFDKLVADAGRAIQVGDYQDALAKLDRAGNRFPTLWSSDATARKIHDDVRCHLLFGRAGESLKSGDLDAAEGKLKEGLGLRPEDKELGKLRDEIRRKRAEQLVGTAESARQKADLDEASRLLQQAIGLQPGDTAVQARLDQVEVERHLRLAEKDLAAADLPSAVDEIIKAHRILEKSANSSTPWSGPARTDSDRLAESLIGNLHDEAKALAGTRQYAEAEEKIKLGLQLPLNDEKLKDEKLSELLKEIEKLETDPKTANLTGKWTWPNGEFELRDNGTDVIDCKAEKLPTGIRRCTGGWTRKGDKLEGRFRVVFERIPQSTEGVVTATIKDDKTLTVFWNKVEWLSKPRIGPWIWRGYGELSWQKVKGSEVPTGDGNGAEDLNLGEAH